MNEQNRGASDDGSGWCGADGFGIGHVRLSMMIFGKYRMLNKKRIVACICFVSVGIGAFHYLFFYSLYLPPRLIVIEGLLSTYISENNGEFPSSRKALEEGEIIKETRNQDGSYSIRRFREKGKWEEHKIDFYRFQIAYGTTVTDLGLKDGILIDLTTGEPAYLITGPSGFLGSLRWRYQMISRKWYEEMCQHAEAINGGN